MIVCVSLNPALDRCIRLSELAHGRVNRAHAATATPGGKAANVALAARALGASVRYLALLGGPTGQAVREGLEQRGVRVEAVPTLAATRVNLELIDERGVTEVLEPGSQPAPEELAELRKRCRQVLADCDERSVVAFSGSLPPGVPPDLYAELIRLAKQHGLRAILDTSGDWLSRGLSGAPDFVKPNREEAEALLGRQIEDASAARTALGELLSLGSRAALVSLGAAGLVGGDAERLYRVAPPELETLSSVGCGDASVAGLACALERGLSPPEQLVFAAACGAANCLAGSPAELDPAQVEALRAGTLCRELA